MRERQFSDLLTKGNARGQQTSQSSAILYAIDLSLVPFDVYRSFSNKINFSVGNFLFPTQV